MSFNAQQEKLRETDDVKVVRVFTQGPFIYGSDSRDRKPNPEYHPPIGLTEGGRFVDVDGRPYPASKLPDYLKEKGAKVPPPEAVPPAPREVKLAEVMQDAMTSADPKATKAAPKARKTRAKK